MPYIFPEILSLMQAKQSEVFKSHRLACCLHCHRPHPHLHGAYLRKADRPGDSEESLNPFPIQRYYCPGCRKTCSVLPECLPPHRWYLWQVQQAALLLVLAGKSLHAAAKELAPSRSTLRRWKARLTEQFHLYKDVLCSHFIALGRSGDFMDFWKACLLLIPLSGAMRLCHVAGVPIP